MANMNKRTRDELYPLVVQQQGGEYCVMCNREKTELIQNGNKGEFCIDVDDNSHNHSKSNLRQMQLLCHPCNTKKNHPSIDEPFSRTATPEMILGKKYESTFRHWVAGHYMTKSDVGLTYPYLLGSGAEYCDCSTESIKRYLKKMASEEGMYEWFNKAGSESLLVLKQKYR